MMPRHRGVLLWSALAVAAALTAAVGGAGANSLCSSLGKTKGCVDGVCSAVRTASCAGKLCTTLKSEDGCDLASKADVSQAINAFETPLYGAWWVDLNEQDVFSCTSEPDPAFATDPSIEVVCSRHSGYVYLMRFCPPGYLAVQGTCGFNVKTVYWEMPVQSFGLRKDTVTCAFRLSDQPPDLRDGRLYASATCMKAGAAAGVAAGAAAQGSSVLNGVQQRGP